MSDVQSKAEYELSLKDTNFSSGVDAASKHVQGLEANLGSVAKVALGVFGGFAAAIGFHKVFEEIAEAREEYDKLDGKLHQLENTLINTGTFSESLFGQMKKDAFDYAETVLFSKSQIIDLQSQIALMGNVNDYEMKRMVTLSADVATKLNLSLGEAGKLISQGINSPEIARRLGQALRIDPAIMKHISDLARHGKEAEARMELLAVAESKVGGAAQQAFNDEPLARFNKTMGDFKLLIGEAAIGLVKVLTPALEVIAKVLKEAAEWVGRNIDLLKAIAIGIGVAAVAIGVYTLVTNAATIGTWLFNAALAAEQALMSINPIYLLIAALAALVTWVVYAWEHFAKFRGYLLGVWETIKEFGRIVADVFIGVGKVIAGVLTFSPSMVVEGAKQTIDAISNAGTRMGEAFHKGFDEGMADFAKDQQKEKSLIPTNKIQNKFAKDEGKPAEPKTRATGSKSVTINVHIQKLGETHIAVTNIKEGMTKLKQGVLDTLSSAVNDFQIVADH